MKRVNAEALPESGKGLVQPILNAISDPLFAVNPDLSIKFLNDAVLDLYKPENRDLIGKPCHLGFMNRPAPCSDCLALQAVRIGKRFSFERKASSDVEKIHQIIIYPVGSVCEEDYFALIHVRDVTDEKKLQQELIQADKMISLGILAAGMAHEINNPNNFITLNTPLLKDAWRSIEPILEKYFHENGNYDLGGLPYSEMCVEIPKLFSGIEEGSRRIQQIVDGLKDFSRQEKAEMNESVDVNEVIRKTISLANNMIRKSTDRFEVEYENNLPALKGNSRKLSQVVLNLLQNACQALPSPEKGIFLRSCYNSPSESIVIEVRDEGSGIANEVLPRIMDPFFTTRRNLGGTGLGLSVSTTIVKEHGGKIDVESKRGEGSVFTVSFPLKRERNPFRILVAEDDRMTVKLIKETLRNSNCLFEEASNGIEACVKLGKYRPDLLILDIQMPHMNGLEVCRFIKENAEFADIRVIIATAHWDSAELEIIAGLGFDAILLKPFEIADLRRMVKKVKTGSVRESERKNPQSLRSAPGIQ